MISVIIPDYKNAKYLDFCLKSAIENQINKNEIIVIIDGIYEGYKEIVDKYKSNIKLLVLKENKGLAYALNIGVSQASNDYVLLVNEDNVFPTEWDRKCEQIIEFHNKEATYCFNQIEPNPSMYDFTHKDFGSTLETFKYKEFLEFEKTLINSTRNIQTCGLTFPFLIKKKLYMCVGGFDLMYPSPFVVDWDFFYKLELMNVSSARLYDINFYHFVNKSTKQNENVDDVTKFNFSKNEQSAMEIFKYKWGFYPNRLKENNWRIKK